MLTACGRRTSAAASASASLALRELLGVLVCARHHTLIHQLGISLALDAERQLSVTRPEGVPLLNHPGLPWGDPMELDPGRHIDGATLPPDNVVSRVDIGDAVRVMMQQSS